MEQNNQAVNDNEEATTKLPGLGGAPSNRRILEGHTRPCEDCGAVNWDFDVTRGEITCGDCGLVAEENVPDPGAEWTLFWL